MQQNLTTANRHANTAVPKKIITNYNSTGCQVTIYSSLSQLVELWWRRKLIEDDIEDYLYLGWHVLKRRNTKQHLHPQQEKHGNTTGVPHPTSREGVGHLGRYHPSSSPSRTTSTDYGHTRTALATCTHTQATSHHYHATEDNHIHTQHNDNLYNYTTMLWKLHDS